MSNIADRNYTKIMVVLLAIFVIVIAFRLGRDTAEVSVATPVPTVVAEPAPTPEAEEETNKPVEHESEWRGYYVAGCTENGGTEAECTCMWDWFRARYTIGEIADLAIAPEGDEATQIAIDGAVAACVNPSKK